MAAEVKARRHSASWAAAGYANYGRNRARSLFYDGEVS
jgi:hypothetical protein